jgi:hypothetical protein
LSLVDRLANVLDPGQHRVDRNEVGQGAVGDDLGEGCFAGAGGTVEDDRGELVGLDGAAQEATGADDRVLADEFIEGAGPHPGGEGRFGGDDRFEVVIEEVHGRRAEWRRLAW